MTSDFQFLAFLKKMGLQNQIKVKQDQKGSFRDRCSGSVAILDQVISSISTEMKFHRRCHDDSHSF